MLAIERKLSWSNESRMSPVTSSSEGSMSGRRTISPSVKSASLRFAATRSRSDRAAMPASWSPDFSSLALANSSRRSEKSNRSIINRSRKLASDYFICKDKWRKRVGVEPTVAAERRRPPVLKTGMITGPHALPSRGPNASMLAVRQVRCIGLAKVRATALSAAEQFWRTRTAAKNLVVFHVEHFVLANSYMQLYTYIS